MTIFGKNKKANSFSLGPPGVAVTNVNGTKIHSGLSNANQL